MIRINFLKNSKPKAENQHRAPRMTFGLVLILITVFFMTMMFLVLMLKSYWS